MATARRIGLIWAALALAPLAAGQAQSDDPDGGKLAEATSIELVDSAALNHLTRVNEYLAGQQWENAVAALRKVGEQYGDGLVKVQDHSVHARAGLTAGWHVSIRHLCQVRLAALPPQALRIYRQQVDDAAGSAFESAARARDRRALQRLLREFFCSSVGDDALLLLGDLSLEAGDYAAARDAWSRITPIEASGNFHEILRPLFEKARQAPGPYAADVPLLEAWYRLEDKPISPERPETHRYRLLADKPVPADVERRLARFWLWHGAVNVLKFPDSGIPLADVDARLVLASILEGAADRAAREVKRFAELHPAAEGVLGGKRVQYATALGELLRESVSWPQPTTSTDWPTFAGSADRNGTRPGEIDVQGKPWKIALPKLVFPVKWHAEPQNVGFRARRVADGPAVSPDDAVAAKDPPLSFLPVIVRDKLLVCSDSAVFAFHLRDGTSASPISDRGMILPINAKPGNGTEEVPTAMPSESFLGTPRFTLTASGSKVFVRIGTPLTAAAETVLPVKQETKLVCLDVSEPARVRSVWDLVASDDWAFEGPPVTDGAQVYVAQRRRGAIARTRVLCYDAETVKGHEPILRWQRFICAANTAAAGTRHECTHNLLTLHQGTLYYNTNLGAVAALDAQDGTIQWLTTYRRATRNSGTAPAFFYRDLNPCLYHDGMLYAAPSDYDGILAIRAATGQIVGAMPQDDGTTAVHLLGAIGDYLIASGDRLWWFDIRHALLGAVKESASFDLPNAYGRGVIVGDTVYVPLRDRIETFDAGRPGQKAPHPIALSALHPGITGGHLIVCDTHLLVVGNEAIWGFELSRPLSSYRPQPAKPPAAGGGSH
jgi:outer membrane protein assembly factor BamB